MPSIGLTGWLALALAASLAGNVAAVYRSGVAHAEAKVAPQLAAQAATIAGLQRANAVSTALANAGTADHTVLLGQLDAIASRGQQQVIHYRDRVSKLPALATNCAPGKDRQDELNALIAAPLIGAAPP